MSRMGVKLRLAQYQYARGMTLLEVMVALMIFAIAAVSITKSLGEMMSNMPVLEQRTLAQWVADNQMVDARLLPAFPALGKTEGKEELAGKTWYWRREIVKTADKDFRMIRISVSEDDRFKRVNAQVSSYVARKE